MSVAGCRMKRHQGESARCVRRRLDSEVIEKMFAFYEKLRVFKVVKSNSAVGGYSGVSFRFMGLGLD